MAPNPPIPPRRSWKDAASPAPRPAAAKKDWQHAAKPPADSRPRSRGAKLALLGGGIVALVVAFVLVLRWLRPVDPPRLVLVGAGYELNLAVPHNVAGRKGLDHLEEWARGYNSEFGGDEKSRIEVHRPGLNGEDDPVAAALKDCDSETVVVFVAAHGGANRDGPFFLRNDAYTGGKNLYRLEDALAALKRLPDKTKKLLLVDATQVAAHWPSGQLRNDFARALKGWERDKRIAVVPNLVVICSSDEGQRSWVAPEWRRTAFTHYVLQGLRGLADRDGGNRNGRVEVRELYDYVSRKVSHWARHNRGALQTPLLLGDKDMAESFELVHAGPGAEEPLPELDPKESFPEVREVWDECAALRQAVPPPEAYTPSLWRHYLDAALRFEQLTLAGDRANAAEMRKTLQGLRDRIRGERAVTGMASLSLSLAMPAAFGVSLPDVPREARQALEKGWEGDPPKFVETGAHLAATRAVLTKAARELEHLSDACRFLARMHGRLLPVRPAESHFLAMLHPRADGDGKSRVAVLAGSETWRSLLGRAIRVRLLAEQAALGLGKEAGEEGRRLPAYSELTHPWIAKTLEDADTKQRAAQNLLFATDEESWKSADGKFGEAEAGYGKARDIAIELRRALSTYHQTLAELPYYTRWSNCDEKKLFDAWAKVHSLGEKLASQPPAAEAFAAARALREPTEACRKALQEITRDFAQALERNFTNTQQSWHDAHDLRSVPFVADWETRRDLIRREREISHVLNRETADSPPSGLNEEDEKRKARQAARRQWGLALAVLGKDPREANVPPESERWHYALVEAGAETAKGFDEMLSKVRGGTGGTPVPLAGVVRQLRRLNAGQVQAARLADDPAAELRRLRLHDLLCWLARRTYDDFWAAEDHERNVENPYYRVAAAAFLDDAAKLVAPPDREMTRAARDGRLADVRKLQKLVNAGLHTQLALAWREGKLDRREGTLNLTDEKKVRRVYQFGKPDGVPDGRPVVWEDHGEGLLDQGNNGKRRPYPFREAYPVTLVPRPEKERPESQDRVTHKVRGLFRGHLVEAVTAIRFHRHPDVTVFRPPFPEGGRLAIQTTVSEAGHTALALVLDCSGSMRDPKAPRADDRLARVQRALEDVMKKVPSGVIVSLRAFGEIESKYYPTRRVGAPFEWKADSIKTLQQKWGELKPGSRTPLVDALVAAKKDFPEDFGGFKTIIVLTDGAESDKQDNQIRQTLKRHFQNTSIGIHVIGVEVAMNDQNQEKQKVFKETIIELGGTYHSVSTTDKLATTLTETMKMRYRIDPDEGSGVRGPAGSITISRRDKRENWSPARVEGDATYRVRVLAGRAEPQRVGIADGDRLFLELVSRDGRLALKRGLYAESHQLKTNRHLGPVKRVRGGDDKDWLLAVLQNQKTHDRVEIMTTLEKDDGIPPTAGHLLQQVRPGMVWFEATSRGGARPAPLIATALPNYPAPAWELLLPRWPGQTDPLLSAWWTERLPEPARTLSRADRDFESLDGLAGTYPLERLPGAPTVVIESVQHERLDLPRQPGDASAGVLPERNCLVVRLRYPPGGGPFFVQLPDNKEAKGQWHRFYQEAGKYTGIFWDMTEGQARELSSLRIYSVGDLKKSTLRVEGLSLGTPDPRWTRPPPYNK